MTERPDRQASRWLARLDRGDLTPQERAAFDGWRVADDRHAVAYEQLEATWQRLDRIQALRAGPSEAIDPDALMPAPSTRWFRAHTPWAAAAGVAALAVSLVTFLAIQPKDPAATVTQRAATVTQRYVTAVGGHERAALNDGSIAELNTDTELRVALSDTERHVVLLQGEATFEVAHDPHRPFIVTAGDLTVRALGTVFNVRLSEDIVDVLVVEGQVALESARGTAMVQAGERAVSDRAGIQIRAIEGKDLKRALAWQKGMLAFDETTLAEAASEFNRYNARRLVVTDPAIAHKRIGGYFRANNVDGFVRVLENHFAIQATREPTQIILTQAPSPTK